MDSKNLIFALVTLLFAVGSMADGGSILRTEEEMRSMYDAWLETNGKSNNALEDNRYEIFKDNLKFVDEHNRPEHGHSFKVGLNRFADLTNEEYRKMYVGTMMDGEGRLGRKRGDKFLYKVGDELPDMVDWREKGAVTAVKDQGSCGSCWAFATIGAVESINQIITGELITLSEQELVECDTSYNQGCNGGLMDYAFQFIIKNGGIDSDKDYPYTGRDGKCDANKKNAKVVTIDSYEDVPVNDEKSLQKAAASQPISVAVEAGGSDFQLYVSGIFTGSCGTNLDHGVIVVGYGTENGQDYWIVKNSWGAAWGEEGYLKMERNIAASTGKCGIAIEPSYPIKNGDNPSQPPPPPPPVKPPTVCDKYYSCPESTTCCCIFNFRKFCFSWGCCPLDGATCCEDHYSCCPKDYPVCNIRAATCSMIKNNPLAVKMLKHIPAQSHWALSHTEGKSSSA